jgi:hypothetical protein
VVYVFALCAIRALVVRCLRSLSACAYGGWLAADDAPEYRTQCGKARRVYAGEGNMGTRSLFGSRCASKLLPGSALRTETWSLDHVRGDVARGKADRDDCSRATTALPRTA